MMWAMVGAPSSPDFSMRSVDRNTDNRPREGVGSMVRRKGLLLMHRSMQDVSSVLLNLYSNNAQCFQEDGPGHYFLLCISSR